MLKINIKPEIKNLILRIIRDLFLACYFLGAVFTALEIVKPRIITSNIATVIFLLILLLLGAITIFYYQPTAKTAAKFNFWDYSAIVLLSILFGLGMIIWVRQIGWLSILVGLATSIIIYYFIILCCRE